MLNVINERELGRKLQKFIVIRSLVAVIAIWEQANSRNRSSSTKSTSCPGPFPRLLPIRLGAHGGWRKRILSLALGNLLNYFCTCAKGPKCCQWRKSNKCHSSVHAKWGEKWNLSIGFGTCPLYILCALDNGGWPCCMLCCRGQDKGGLPVLWYR